MESESSSKSSESGKGSSECQETEQDSDGIWSAASEYKSDAESDLMSSDSVSHELLTVRDKTDHSNKEEIVSDIQQLISDAESLALERNQSLGYNSQVVSMPKQLGGASLSNAEYCPKERNADVNSHRDAAAKQSSFENDDSGYYGRTDAAKDAPFTLIPKMCKNDQHVCNQDLPKIMLHSEAELTPKATKLESLSHSHCPARMKISDYPSMNSGYDSRSDLPLNSNSETYPVSVKNTDAGRNPEGKIPVFKNVIEVVNCPSVERVPVMKDIKEERNSSIKECHESPGVSLPAEKGRLSVSSSTPLSPQFQKFAPKEVSSLVHDECSNLLRLALNSTSSFGRIMRLLRQVMTLQFGMETPRVAESVQHELQEFEKQHVSLQSQLSEEATRLQTTLSQVQALESCFFEIQSDHNAVNKSASAILQQIEECLSSCSLQHMIAVTSPRRHNVGRILEDVESAIALLLGELSRKTTHCQNLEKDLQSQDQEREALQKSLTDRESRLLYTSRELEQTKSWSHSEISSLKQCLAQAEGSIAEIRLEKEFVSDTFKRQGDEDKQAVKKLQKQLVDTQHSADLRVSRLENCLQEMTKEKIHLESLLMDLKNKLSIQEQQMNLMNEEHMLLVEGLRSTIKHQQSDGEKLRLLLEQATNEKQIALRQSEESSKELAKLQESYDKLHLEVSGLTDKIRDMGQENKDSELALQNKIDTLTGVRHDLERQLRARDLNILHLQTEVRLDGTQIHALREDNNNLLQKVQNLQERLWEATRRRRRHGSSGSKYSDDHSLNGKSHSENGSVLSLLASSEDGCPTNQKVKSLEKDINDGQSREEHLHKILSEKDETIRNLQNSLSTELAAKNQELEMLRKKLPELEDQMSSLLSAIEVNEAMGHVTTEVGRRLQERQEYLENINRSSNLLQDEYAMLAVENHSLKSELAEHKKMSTKYSGETLESARKAKEEARRERLNSARLEEQCSKLQAELKCTSILLEQERRERAMRDMVQQFKHEDFGAVLSSTVSPGMDSL